LTGERSQLDYAVTGLSIVLQFIAAALAVRIAIASRQMAWLPLALAVLLMGVRRSFSLYSKVTFEQAIDLGAESIALTISALMVVGLFGMRRWSVADTTFADQGSLPLSLLDNAVPRMAVILGGLAVVASCATGYLAFRASRLAIHETIYQGQLISAQMIARHADALSAAASDMSTTDPIREFWQKIDRPYRTAYLCVVRSDGELLQHTLRESKIGANVGDLPIDTGRSEGPMTIQSLVTAGEDWVGDFTSTYSFEAWLETQFARFDRKTLRASDSGHRVTVELHME
jgi:hypothetical protein